MIAISATRFDVRRLRVVAWIHCATYARYRQSSVQSSSERQQRLRPTTIGLSSCFLTGINRFSPDLRYTTFRSAYYDSSNCGWHLRATRKQALNIPTLEPEGNGRIFIAAPVVCFFLVSNEILLQCAVSCRTKFGKLRR